jgi:hypothetical protein
MATLLTVCVTALISPEAAGINASPTLLSSFKGRVQAVRKKTAVAVITDNKFFAFLIDSS